MRLLKTLCNYGAVGACVVIWTRKPITAETKPFPDHQDSIPKDYNGKTFVLSQDYPRALPPKEAPWEEIDFRMAPLAYLDAVKRYVLEGNIDVDFRVHENPVRKWYHAPWLHYGSHGRECIHGLTRERDSRFKELSESQHDRLQNWAVGFYNPRGGYTLGQVWANPSDPDPAKAVFPVGTVAAKVLFTEATPESLPDLAGSLVWEANVHQDGDPSQGKTIKKLHLLQMDIAVKDPRASDTTGWVFGSFIHDATHEGSSPWDRMVPVGLMWGNDPGKSEADVERGDSLQQTLLNPNLTKLGKRSLGFAGRLNGPVDSFIAACISCHSAAQLPGDGKEPPLGPTSTSPQEDHMRWFRNLKSRDAFNSGNIPLDYSLQLRIGIQNLQESKRRGDDNGNNNQVQ